MWLRKEEKMEIEKLIEILAIGHDIEFEFQGEERSQTLDLIRFIGFTTSIISTLFLLKINQFRLSDHHK